MDNSFKTSLLLIAVFCFAADASIGNDGSCPCASQSGEMTTLTSYDGYAGGMSTLSGSAGVMPVSYRPAMSGGVIQVPEFADPFADSQDHAQSTLGEDWFLKPEFGNAVLHLDVPYDADVRVERPFSDGKKTVWYKSVLQSRGQYRDLVLPGMPIGERTRVNVHVTRWLDDPTCDKDPVTICRSVFLMAGDRKYLPTVGVSDFDTMRGGIVMTASASNGVVPLLAGGAVAAEPAAAAAPKEDNVFRFGEADLSLAVSYKPDDFTGKPVKFAGPKQDLDNLALRILHETSVAKSQLVPTKNAILELTFAWKYDGGTKSKTVKIKFASLALTFIPKDKKPPYTATLLLKDPVISADPKAEPLATYRSHITDTLTSALWKGNAPHEDKITLTGAIVLDDGLKFNLRSPLIIKVMK